MLLFDLLSYESAGLVPLSEEALLVELKDLAAVEEGYLFYREGYRTETI